HSAALRSARRNRRSAATQARARDDSQERETCGAVAPHARGVYPAILRGRVVAPRRTLKLMPAIEHVVILGNGVAAWLAALSLRHFSKGRIRVSVLQDPQAAADPELECGPHAMPTLIELHRALAIDEREFMRATAATFKLGTRFAGWGGEGSDYFHPFGDTGATLEGIPFHQHWLRVLKSEDLSQFSLGAVAARQARFVHPSPDPRSILSTLAYGYHFDPARYAGFIRARAETAGAVAIEGSLSDTALRASDGAIEALVLEGGNRISADLYIDCSGEGLLIGRTLQTPFEDWSAWLACDRALAGAHQTDDELAPYTTASAAEGGWLWQVPLQHRTERGYAYCSAHVSVERALETLQSAAPNGGWMREPRVLRVKNGRRARFWTKNCVALGLAAGFLEPLEGTGLHLIHRGISRLTSLLPACER